MIFLLLALFTLFFNSPILASGNTFGLHLTQTSDLDSAKNIINSSGGDWGWVTIVIRTDQLNINTWQNFFDDCRKYHLIPIVRLATIMDGNSWKRPALSDIDNLANFLNSLNWPTQQQHIILFNEINHASEWGGGVDVKNYTDTALYAIQKLKSLNQNFFILGSGLDLAAPDKLPNFLSAPNTYREIYSYQPQYFELLDGLASHSYPNYGFVGSPADQGQHSIRGYQWELTFLKNLGVQKTYPVFITETGWPHREGEKPDNRYFTSETTGRYLTESLKLWSSDPQIVAITPFIYNYQSEPFDHFAWLDPLQNLYPEYRQLVDLPKFKNSPAQITRYEVKKIHLPFLIFIGNDYSGQIIIKNTGQSIWGETNFCLTPQTTPNIELDSLCSDNTILTKPGEQKVFSFKFKIKNLPEYKDKTFLSWTNLPTYEITPLDGSGTIYHSKSDLIDKVRNFFNNLL